MKMTVPETKTAMLALYLAIEWENSLVDAHRIGLRFNKKTGHVDKVVPGDFRPIVNRCKRNIARFQKLRSSLAERIKCQRKNPKQ